MECSKIKLSRKPQLEAPVHEVISLTQQDYIKEILEELNYLGRSAEIEEMRGFLNDIKDLWLKKNRGETVTSKVAYVIGEWGMGKTAFADYIAHLCMREKIYCVKQTFDNIKNELSKNLPAGRITNPRGVLVKLVDLFTDGGKALTKDLPIIVIIDEMEAIAKPQKEPEYITDIIIDQFLLLFKALVDPRIGEEDELLMKLRGRLHLILMLTPEAHMRLNNIISLKLAQEGRYERRPDRKIRLRPLLKEELLLALEKYVQKTVGIELSDLFTDLRLINAIYLLSGGAPGTALDLLRKLIRESIRHCKTLTGESDCFCMINPYLFLQYLQKITIETPSGKSIEPIRADYVSAILKHKMDTEILMLIASTSFVTKNEVNDRSIDFIKDLGLDVSEVYIIGQSKHMNRHRIIIEQILSEILDKECHGSVDCIHIMRYLLQSFKQYSTNGEIILTLPSNYDVFVNWARYFGWNISGIDEESYYSMLKRLFNKIQTDFIKGYVLAPSDVSKIYIVHTTTMVPFITSKPLAQEIVAKVYKYEKDEPRTFNYYIRIGFSHVLKLGLGQDVIDVVDINKGFIYYNAKYNDINYRIPIKIDLLINYSGREKLCYSFNKEPMAFLLLSLESEGTVDICSRSWIVYVSPQILRELAALGIALEKEDYRTSVNESVLIDYSHSLVTLINVEGSLERLKEKLVMDGLLVALPQDPYAILSSYLPGQIKDKIGIVLDVHKFLVTFGSGPPEINTVDWLLENLEKLIKSLPYSGTPELPTLKLSSIDLRDYSKETLKALIEGSLLFLSKLGLIKRNVARNRTIKYQYELDYLKDPVSRYLVNIMQSEDVKGLNIKQIARFFILPLDQRNLEEAQKRIQLSMNILFHKGYLTFKTQESLCRDYSCKIPIDWSLLDLILVDNPSVFSVSQDDLNKLMKKVNDLNKSRTELKKRLKIENDTYIGELIICKQKKCMSMGLREIMNLIKILKNIFYYNRNSTIITFKFIDIVNRICIKILETQKDVIDSISSDLVQMVPEINEIKFKFSKLHEDLVVTRISKYPNDINRYLLQITNKMKLLYEKLLDDYNSEIISNIREKMLLADNMIRCLNLNIESKREQKQCNKYLSKLYNELEIYFMVATRKKYRIQGYKLEKHSPHLILFVQQIDEFENYIEKIKKKYHDLEDKLNQMINVLDMGISTMKDDILTVLSSMSKIIEGSSDLDQFTNYIEALTNNITFIIQESGNISSLRNRYNTQKNTILDIKENKIKSLHSKFNELVKELNVIYNLGSDDDKFLDKYRSRVRQYKDNIAIYINRLNILAAKIDDILKNISDEFNSISTEHSYSKLKDLINKIENGLNELNEIKFNIDEIEEDIVKLNNDIEQLKISLYNEIKERLSNLIDDVRNIRNNIEYETVIIPRELENILIEIKSLEEEIEKCNDKQDVLKIYELFSRMMNLVEKAYTFITPEIRKKINLVYKIINREKITFNELISMIKNYYNNVTGDKLIKLAFEILELAGERGYQIEISLRPK